MTKKILISTFVSTVILFLWSGLSQFFPWGVPTTQTITLQATNQSESFQSPQLIKLSSNNLTTDQFDDQFVNKISTLTTDRTFSWIITKPVDNYNVGSFFAVEIFTQFMVAFLLAVLLWLTVGLKDRKRLLIVTISGILAVSAIYGQMMNWWGVPPVYALGAGFNLIIGWVLSAFVSSRFILTKKQWIL